MNTNFELFSGHIWRIPSVHRVNGEGVVAIKAFEWSRWHNFGEIFPLLQLEQTELISGLDLKGNPTIRRTLIVACKWKSQKNKKHHKMHTSTAPLLEVGSESSFCVGSSFQNIFF